jgi:hypothetical protein
MRPALLLVLLSAALAGCDPLFFAEIEERRICFEQLQAVDAAPPIGFQTVSWEDTLDLSDGIPGLENGAVTGDIRLLGARVAGSTSLAGVSSASVTVVAPDRPAARVASYTRPASVPDPNVISLEGSPGVNLLDYLRSTSLGFRIDLSGSPPTTAWQAAVEVCLSVDVVVDLLEAAEG